jgi:hypothetical protein
VKVLGDVKIFSELDVPLDPDPELELEPVLEVPVELEVELEVELCGVGGVGINPLGALVGSPSPSIVLGTPEPFSS